MNLILKYPTVIVIVLINLYPLYGINFLNFEPSSIIIFYWIETVVIGIFNILKIILNQNPKKPSSIDLRTKDYDNSIKTKVKFAGFFALHFGFFNILHLFFLLLLLNIFAPGSINLNVLPLGILILVVGHLSSFLRNYIGQEEYKKEKLDNLFKKPYIRIFIMHFAIIATGFLLAMKGNFQLFNLIIILKTLGDIYLHIKERNIK